MGFPKIIVLGLGSAFLGATGCSLWSPGVFEPAAAQRARYDLRRRGAFSPHFEPFILGEKLMLAEDVAIFRFLLPNADDQFDLKPCSTLQCQHSTGSNRIERVQRSYTPITPYGTKGYFDIVVKKQPRGRMTEHLFSMEPGESIEFRAVIHKLHYTANKYRYIGCIAGGTGISSVLQIIREVCDNPHDFTKVSLLYGNQTEGKILLRGVIDDLAGKHPDKFRAFYTVDRLYKHNAHTWDGFVGWVDEEMVKWTMPPPGPGTMLLLCGPDILLQKLAGVRRSTLKAMSGGRAQQPQGHGANNFGRIGGLLADLGYTTEQVYRF